MENLVFYYFIALLAIFVFSGILNKKFFKMNLPDVGGRDVSIDGLRGYLALNVMVHHYYIFYVWSQTGSWKAPDLVYIKNLGHASVFVFFMITGYLFVGKIRRALSQGKTISWGDLFVSRVFRIAPLYFLVVVLTFLITFYEQGFVLNVTQASLAKEFLKWCAFIGWSVNGNDEARLIHAGVTWTLRYEWLFYLSLPVLFLLLKKRTLSIALTLIAIIFYFKNYYLYFFETKYFIFFAVGGIVSWLKDCVQKLDFKSKYYSALCVLIGSLAVALDGTDSEFYLTASSMIFFFLIAFGNDIFGILSAKTSRLIGEVSYSIYLLHGVVIYVIFHVFLFKFTDAHEGMHAWLIIPVGMIVVLVSMFTFKNIEAPFYEMGKNISRHRRNTKVSN